MSLRLIQLYHTGEVRTTCGLAAHRARVPLADRRTEVKERMIAA